MTTNIAKPQIHPAMREVIQRIRAERFSTQQWTPGCALCGKHARRPLQVDDARAWFAAHRESCSAALAA